MNPSLITKEQLQELSGYKLDAHIEQYLRSKDIPFFASKNGPWTTIDLVNAAGGLGETKKEVL